MSNRIEVFYAYAPEDETWVRELEKHLSLLARQGIISTWHPRLIAAGEDWQHVIDVHFQRASIILLLISPDFLASDYCYGNEMRQALQREREKGVCVIPILLRPVDWQSAPFAHLRPLPSDATFLTEWTNLDRAFAEITIGIRHAIENLSLLAASLARTDFPSVWNVPFPQNLFFIGREDLLAQLHTQQLHQGRTAALTQAISGLGGVGKTQLAVEYAYRFHHDYQAVLWAHAESTEVLTSSYTEMATLLNLPVKDSQEQAVIIQAVKVWLQNHRDWLLILDNADELDILLAFLPPRLGGHVIITTRAAASGRFAQRLLVETFPKAQGILFLLRRAGLIALDADASQALPQDQTVAELITQEVGGLPLALDQIGAYLEATGCSLATYWQLYQQYRIDLLKDYRGMSVDHSPVATTWSLSFARVEERNPAAADLLRLCAFLAPDVIYEDMLMQGADTLTPTLSAALANGYLLNQAIETLRAYSLITRDTQTKALAVHRLVQTIVRDSLPTEVQKQWMLHVVALVNQAFPDVEFTRWPQCERCLPHTILCAQWIKQEQIVTPEAMRLLDLLGYYLTVRGQYNEAGPFLQQALSIREQQLGLEHLDTATSLYHLALLYRRQGKYREAEPMFEQALSIREQHLGPEHPDTATCLDGLATLYQAQGKYREAEPVFERALSIREQHLGPEHPDTAISLNSLARLYEKWGRYTQAEALVLRSLSISERQSGLEHPDTADSLHNLTLLYRRQGKYAQAEPLALRSLAIREQQLGSEHPDTVNALSNLVRLYASQGKYVQAEPLALRELALREQQLGSEHPAIAFSLANLVLLYTKLKKYTEAEPLALRGLAIREQQLGSNHPYTALSLNDLANLYASQGKYVEAEPLYLRALAIREQQLGPEHPETAFSLNDLANLYASQGKYVEAEPLYLRALAIREQQLGPEHPDTALSLHDLASFYATQSKYAEADKLYQRALATRVQQLGPEHPDTQSTQERYEKLLQQKRNP